MELEDSAERTRAFRDAVIAAAADGPGAPLPGRPPQVRCAVLVEGLSDVAAVEALAEARGRDLAAEGVCVVAMGGATSIGRFVAVLGPHGLDVPLAGLCDAGEERFYRRSLADAGLDPGEGRDGLAAQRFHVCVADLEDELIRALGTGGVEDVIEARGDGSSLRLFRGQPAQRGRTAGQQLRRFLGTTRGRKIAYGRALVEALDPARVPRPLDALLTAV